MLDLLKTPKAATISTANGTATVSQETPGAIVAVPLVQILDNPYQPRGSYDPEHILKLAASIKSLKANLPATMGLQQVPLARLVLRQRDGSVDVAARHLYNAGRAQRAIHEEPNAAVQLMFGHSRLRALMVLCDGLRYTLKHNHIGTQFNSVAEVETTYAELLDPDGDYATMPLVLGFALDHEMWRHAITENSQRKNITAIEEAISIERAMEEFGLSLEEAGKPFGYARSTANNKVRLRKLPEDVQQMISRGELTERHGRELLRLVDDPERVKKLVELVSKKEMSVRELANSVDYEEKDLKERQQKVRELAAARQALVTGWQLTSEAAPVPPEAVTDLPDWKFSEFDINDKGHVALLQQGKCSSLCCPCFVVGYSNYRADRGVRPDPMNAPHVCLACTDSAERYRKERTLGDLGLSEEERQCQAERAEKKRQATLRNNEAHTVWQAWLKNQDKAALWNSVTFWQVAANHTWQLEPIFRAASDVQTACAELLKLFYQNTREYDREADERVHTVTNVKKLIKSLSPKRAAQIKDDDEQDEDY